MVRESIRKSGNWYFEQSEIWTKPDLPIAERVEKSLLFGIKYLLNLWGYPRKNLWVDVPSKTISCGPEKVATICVSGTKIDISYSTGWDSWDIFTNNIELKEMIEKQQGKLLKGSDGKGKGEKGKRERNRRVGGTPVHGSFTYLCRAPS